jgi:hypothetical protein
MITPLERHGGSLARAIIPIAALGAVAISARAPIRGESVDAPRNQAQRAQCRIRPLTEGATALQAKLLSEPPGLELQPSREGFFEQVLFAPATPRTPLFEATPESYHANKAELIRLLPSFARERGINLLGVVTVGPSGRLWEYRVIAFIEEGASVRVNQVVFPHARLTAKWTRLMERADYRRLLVDLRGFSDRIDKRSLRNRGMDFRTDGLWVDLSDSVAEYRALTRAPNGGVGPLTTAFLERMDEVLSKMEKTY